MTLRSAIVRASLRLYPRGWRERYGPELMQLVEDSDAGPADLADLALAGILRRLHPTAEEVTSVNRSNARRSASRPATLLAATAVAIAAPTAVFIGMAVLQPNVSFLGIEQPFGVAPPRYLNWLLPLLPFVALGVALAPVIRLGVGRDEAGAWTATARLGPVPRPLLVAITLCAAVVAVVVAYGISENLLEAMR
jgi:hypothetical protein